MHGSAGLGVILIVSLLLGLRHASDPDHLAAVTTLIASEEERARVRMAGSMSLIWGLGHGTTLAALCFSPVFFCIYIPAPLQLTTEVIVVAVIIFPAGRLLHWWWRKFY